MYKPIIGCLGYVISPDGKKTLLVHRNKRSTDQHLGKYNGLGGKMEATEDVVAAMKREIFEESGLICDSIVLRGTINWTGFGPNGEDWLGFVFRIDSFKGEPFLNNEEGDLSWVDIDRLDELPMWEGDKYFLPLVFDDDARTFHGIMPYENESPISWNYSRI
ncbi:MAG: 8-oxo-dGTP diphosphatase [Desulfotalea sp.]